MNAALPVERMDRVLVVDDEPEVQRLVVFTLREAGLDAEGVANGLDALTAIARNRPSIVVLDLMLPDMTGTEICKRIRADAALSDISVLMLTGRGDEYDRLLGFEVGADDYVVKPFSIRELVMRVRCLVRRPGIPRALNSSSSAEAPPLLRWSGIELDPTRHRTSIDGRAVLLRPLEFKLLHAFMRQSGCVLSRAQLLEEVWGVTGEGSTRTVDTHVRRLRERMHPYIDAIETVHGFGYKLREEGDVTKVA